MWKLQRSDGPLVLITPIGTPFSSLLHCVELRCAFQFAALLFVKCILFIIIVVVVFVKWMVHKLSRMPICSAISLDRILDRETHTSEGGALSLSSSHLSVFLVCEIRTPQREARAHTSSSTYVRVASISTVVVLYFFLLPPPPLLLQLNSKFFSASVPTVASASAAASAVQTTSSSPLQQHLHRHYR